MKAKRLLTVLGDVNDAYIAELYAPNEMRTRSSGKRVWLIAAIVALMLALVGCAVVHMLRMRDLKLTDNPYSDAYATESTEKTDTISMQGYADSPNYLAAKEWVAFKKSYDPDLKIMQSLSNEERIMPEEYWSYNCYTTEMTAKIDEICEKYGLIKQGAAVMMDFQEPFFDALQIEGVVREDAKAEIVIHPQYFYKTGTFMLSCETKLSGEDSLWDYNIEYQFYSVMKTDFDDVFLNVGDIETYDQWEFITWNGVQVLLARSPDKALVFADNGTAFITINIMNPRAGDVVNGEQMISWEALEAFADTFDFSYAPQPVSDKDWETLQDYLQNNEKAYGQKREEAMQAIAGESYAEYVQYLLENASRPDMLDYTLLDINGDGLEELLIARRQHICSIFTIEEDNVVNLLEYSAPRNLYNYLWEVDGKYTSPSPMYLCEENAVACIYKDKDTNRVIYHFAVPVDGEMVWMEEIAWEQNKDEASYYAYTTEDGIRTCTPISEARYNEVLSTYVRVKLEWTPLSEYPLE